MNDDDGGFNSALAMGKINFESIVQMVYKLTLNSNFERRCSQQNQKVGVARPRCDKKVAKVWLKIKEKRREKTFDLFLFR